MFLTHLILISLAAGTAVSSHHYYALNPHVFSKRQQYRPDEYNCGNGDTCEESCGAGYLLCSDPDTFLCYNPQLAHTCCEPGSAASCEWFTNGVVSVILCSHIFPGGCPNGDYCLIDGWCCPNSLDPQACALSFSISLPATFVGPTATPVVSDVTSAVATPTSASISVTTVTGAASPSIFTGGRGLIYTVLILVGNLF